MIHHDPPKQSPWHLSTRHMSKASQGHFNKIMMSSKQNRTFYKRFRFYFSLGIWYAIFGNKIRPDKKPGSQRQSKDTKETQND